MQKNEVKRDFTVDQIIKIMLSLGSEDYKKGFNGELIFQTICHNDTGGSYKLYYYPESKLFHCYTGCGDSFNIYDLVMKRRDCEFKESLNYINSLLNIKSSTKHGFFASKELIDDWEIFKKYKKQNSDELIDYDFKTYPPNLIDYYFDIPPVEWLEEDITEHTLRKYNIRYDLTNNKIVIPHYNIHSQLIGIRGRALNQLEIDQGKKYMPLILENKIFKHPLNYNLYGLNLNIGAIKQTKKIMIYEAEKSVLKCSDYYGENNFTVACCGSNISNYHREIILNLGVREVFIAFDKEYHKAFDKESDEYSEKILKLAYKFCPYVTTYVLWDTEDLLDYKDAPCDKGKQVLEQLMKNKFEVQTREES